MVSDRQEEPQWPTRSHSHLVEPGDVLHDGELELRAAHPDTVGDQLGRLLRTGAIRAHIYRDILGFTTGPAEIELEAIGFDHPVPASTEAQALQLLLDRARANAI